MKILIAFLISFLILQPCFSEYTYTYPITPTRIIDGDTFVCDIHLGLDLTLTKQKIRLFRCDAYEMSTTQGLEAMLLSKNFLSSHTTFLVTQSKRDSFGRILGDVITTSGIRLSDLLTSSKLTTGRYK